MWIHRTVRPPALLSIAGLMTACAHAPETGPTAPDYAPITGDPDLAARAYPASASSSGASASTGLAPPR